MTDSPSPAFSIIVPARNMERFVAETLQSVQAQTWKDFEVICLDDQSTDGTRNLMDGAAGRDGRFRVIAAPSSSAA